MNVDRAHSNASGAIWRDAILRHVRRGAAPTIVGLVVTASQLAAGAAEVVLSATTVGSVRRVPGAVYAHLPVAGYLTGSQGNELQRVDYNSYFSFDLTGVSGVIQSAKFRIYTSSSRADAPEGGYWSNDASETFELHGFSGNAAALTMFPTASAFIGSTEYGVLNAMFADLADGPLFGSVEMTEVLAEEITGSVVGQPGGRIWEIPLTEAAVASLNAASSPWILGGSLSTVQPPDSSATELLFLGSAPFSTLPGRATPIPQLVLAVADATAADFNGDQLVDGSDFLIWQRHVGQGGQLDNANGDASGNGIVGAEDLAIWSPSFGAAAVLAVNSVPEWSTLSGMVMAVAVAAVAARTRNASLRVKAK
ncbi:MAG: hypothetical protein KF847_19605 [Pirellulales bacterium]|nr:hypothetical protein [Pirellulales bacterium]